MLSDHMEMLAQATDWLNKSYEKCKTFSLDKLDEDALVEFEALTNRFGRVTDILIQKVYRAIDYVELETQGTLIDIVNRAHKRGLIDDVEIIRQLKDLRNAITHEYVAEDLGGLFSLTLKFCPVLLGYVELAKKYVLEKFILVKGGN
jgi:hypothetical protein